MTARPPLPAPPASLGRRAGAFAIDVASSCGLFTVLSVLLVFVVMATGATRDHALVAVVAITSYAGLVACLLAWWLVYSAMQGGRGSIGQRALGLRLQDATSSERIGFWRAVLRNIVWSLAGSIIVGYFTPLFDGSPRRQGWHDMAARAVVVDVRGAGQRARAAAGGAAAVPAGPPAAVASIGWPAYAAPAAPAGPAPLMPGAMPAAASSATPATVPVAVPAASPAPAAQPPFVTDAAPAPLGAAAPAAAAVLAPVFASAAPAPSPTAPGAGVGTIAAPAQRTPVYTGTPMVAVLAWDDGTRMAVYGRTLYGRNPAGDADAVTVAVRDETLSLSKTHFEIGVDERGPWIADRHSTNGTVLVRDGGRYGLVPGGQTMLRDADRLELGDRSVTVTLT